MTTPEPRDRLQQALRDRFAIMGELGAWRYDNGVELTNPGPKADGLYLEATVQDNHYTVDGGSTALYCQAPVGVLPRGTCRLTFCVTPPPYWLELGPARLTIRLQRGADDSVTALDRRTLDVVLVHS